MKIDFNDKSFIDIKKTDDNKIIVHISARDGFDPLKRVNNSVELTSEQCQKLIGDI